MTSIATIAKIQGGAHTVLNAVVTAVYATERYVTAKVANAAAKAIAKTDALVLKADQEVLDAEDALVEARAAHSEAQHALRAKYNADKLALDKFHDAIFNDKTSAIYAAQDAAERALAHRDDACTQCEDKLGVYFD